MHDYNVCSPSFNVNNYWFTSAFDYVIDKVRYCIRFYKKFKHFSIFELL